MFVYLFPRVLSIDLIVTGTQHNNPARKMMYFLIWYPHLISTVEPVSRSFYCSLFCSAFPYSISISLSCLLAPVFRLLFPVVCLLWSCFCMKPLNHLILCKLCKSYKSNCSIDSSIDACILSCHCPQTTITAQIIIIQYIIATR